MKKLISFLFILGGITILSAQNLNQYKYVIIPETYEFTGETDQYRLNSLTKFLFEEEGFSTLMKTEELPPALENNPCGALNVEVKNDSGLFVTKLKIFLKDCNGRTVFESEEGKSREKDFQIAYQEALRNAFETINDLNYKYQPVKQAEKKSVEVTLRPDVKANPQKITGNVTSKEETKAGEVGEKVKEVSKELPKTAEESNSSSLGNTYKYSGQNYVLKQNAQGFGLFQEKSTDPIAILIKSGNSENSFIYNSLTNQGIAYFDSNKNLVVEYFNKTENKKVVITYEIQY